MTAPVTSLTLHIDDDGVVRLSAPDWAAEGHLWAIESRPISIETLRNVAAALGPDAMSGVEARLRAILIRKRQIAETADAALARANDAKMRVEALQQLIDHTPAQEQS